MPPLELRILYLHGLASSPLSTKAQEFSALLAAAGLSVRVPDLNEGDFRGLTTTRALALACGEAADLRRPFLIFGSSFGGRVGALAAARLEGVAGLMLMAPAFEIETIWRDSLGAEGLERWRDEGSLMVEHPVYEGEVPLGYEFYADALATSGLPALPPELPVLIFHGRGDDVVPLAGSERFAAQHGATQLVVLDADHSLTGQAERMWPEVLTFVNRCLSLPTGELGVTGMLDS